MRVHIPFFFYIFLFLMLFLVEAFVGAFQDPCAVEDGDEGFVGAFFGLDVAVVDAEVALVHVEQGHAGDQPALDLGQPELRPFLGHHQVAGQRQFGASAERGAGLPCH